MAVADAGHLRDEARRAERVVEVAPLPVEHVRVRVRPVERWIEVGEAGLLERRDRVLLGVGVVVADERTSGSPVPVGSDASQSPAPSPRSRAPALQLPWPSPASGASHALPLLLRWLASATNVPPVAFAAERLRERGTVARARVAAVDERDGVEHRRRPTGVTAAGL